MAAPIAFLLLSLVTLVPLAAVAGGGPSIPEFFPCGGTAPEVTSCTTGKHAWWPDSTGQAVAWCTTPGGCGPFSGEVTSTVQWRRAAFSYSCTAVEGRQLTACTESGARPTERVRVRHTCTVTPAYGSVGPQGEWVCTLLQAPRD